MEPLWNIDNSNESTEKTLQFIEEQANALSELTDGKVLAIFRKRRVGSMEAVARAIKAPVVSREVMGKSGEDASLFYSKQSYEFYITDKYRQYELSVFDMICNDEYPIDVRVEKTISEEERLPPEFTAHSYQEFLSFFKAVIGANKVNYIIRSLMKRIE